MSSPPIDFFHEGRDGLLVAELPGASPHDLRVFVADEIVRVSGRFAAPAPDHRYLQRERPFGEFSRDIILPALLRNPAATARFDNGLLVIRIRSEESEFSAERRQDWRRIEIQGPGNIP